MRLPNIRELFIPDPGMLIADIDLDRADAQVVAWDANDPTLKQAMKLGVDLHTLNAYAITGQMPPPLEHVVPGNPHYPEIKKAMAAKRPMAKAWCHGTNYGGSARTMAIAAQISIKASEAAQRNYFSMYPGIKAWHEQVEHDLEMYREVKNMFGFKRFYFDRVEGLLPQALAWIPQSTVGLVINEAWENIRRELPEVQVLLQVHDSLVVQFPKELFPDILKPIWSCMQVTVPYPDPLIIPSGIKISNRSWGHCKDISWDTTILPF